MDMQTVFTEAERELVLDLLLREHRQLPAEIHHTRQREMHESLQDRLKLVTALIERLQKTPAGAAAD